ncbi:hypothetical protein Sgleb_18480 [Streptomyces glebosus]|uniref:Uncharacterized protein n=1 Tax=Streptomyces glebosus TaxID=249580 RepID=A0A640SU62_9ACTN|nr:hypothetical protein Sgleb_18480 [Streptomyces glebosus]GHG82236.1 hypothetical protein GCM10010513_61130 [Streptomyces glebosus]
MLRTDSSEVIGAESEKAAVVHADAVYADGNSAEVDEGPRFAVHIKRYLSFADLDELLKTVDATTARTLSLALRSVNEKEGGPLNLHALTGLDSGQRGSAVRAVCAVARRGGEAGRTAHGDRALPVGDGAQSLR